MRAKSTASINTQPVLLCSSKWECQNIGLLEPDQSLSLN